MHEIIDDYCWEKQKKVITFDYHHIVGLKNFSYWNLSRAVVPTPMHYHTNIIEFHCLVKGKRYCLLGEDETYTILGNELFVTFPTEFHGTGVLSQNPVEFYGFQIDITDRDNLLGLNKEFSNLLYTTLISLKHRHLKLDGTHISLLKKAFQLFSAKNQTSTYAGVQYLCCFLFNLPNLYPVDHLALSTRDEQIQKVLDYIEENFCSNISLKELAEIACLSLSRFKIKFKEDVGITPAEYITLRKIEYARKQLENTSISITTLALDIGFSSSNYFCSVFKKILNYSPSEYRERFTSLD